MNIISASLSQAEHDYAWSGSMELTDPAAYQRIRIDDPIFLQLGEETFKLIVDSKTMDRDGVGRPKLMVSLISPTARFTTPRAETIDEVWNEPVWAKDAVEIALGESVEWDLVNWQIAGGRLAVYGAYPLDIARTIVEAAGGMVETLPSGVLRARHRFPVAVPAWETAIVDHVLTDTSDNLACRESHTSRIRVNKILIRDFLPSGTGYLAVELDARAEGPNHGKTFFSGGDTAHLLVSTGPGVKRTTAKSSAGSLLDGAWAIIEQTQDVVFSNTGTALLDKPADSIESVVWIGNDLGVLTLEVDKRTLSAEKVGVAIARVRYKILTQSLSLTVPGTVGGLSDFQVQVSLAGETFETLGTGEIYCQRGDGLAEGTAVSEPLLSSDDAKRSRGRAEIDAGEPLQEVSLTCLHRAGILPGQLIEIHDSLMGQSWRGKIISVSHAAQGARLTTSLEILRRVQLTV
ncbi:MAG: hypothetical protein H7839_00950 [Magnetococcus sp. YQC-5]